MMRRLALIAFMLLLRTPPASGADAGDPLGGDSTNRGRLTSRSSPPYQKASPEAMQWWQDAKFGLFVHWGVYSVAGGVWSKDGTIETRFAGDAGKLTAVSGYSEHLLRLTNMPLSEYEKLAERFDWSKFRAQNLIDLCYASGQRYIVITSKHHDGFAMWRSKASKWNIGDATPYGRASGRDPLKELADACHATKTAGPWEIKLCFYYSHCADWYEEDAAAFGYQRHHDPAPATFQHYLDRKVKPQLTELLSNYGEVGMIWFDVPRILSIDQVRQLSDLVHQISPRTIMSGRLGHDVGNYASTGDNGVVGVPLDYPWETGSSINDSFGYRIDAGGYKSPNEIITKLIEVTAHGGNYLLNIGPRADGTIAEKDAQILREVGNWTNANGEALFGTARTPYSHDSAVMPQWGTCTQKGNVLYLFVQRWPKDGRLTLPLLQNGIRSVHFITDPRKTALAYARSKDENGNDVVIIDVPEVPPQKPASVITVECDSAEVKLAPFKHAYDAAKREIRLSAANFQAFGRSVKSVSFYYDREQKAIVNWRYGKGGGSAVAWTFDVPEPGDYVVEMDCAITRRQVGLPIDVTVDDKVRASFVTQSTGGDDAYKRVAIGTVRLDGGQHEIAFVPQKSSSGSPFVMKLRGVHLTRKP
jgi:alpha-L-fucosidase